ncbi:MAG: DUF3592 domain-containing protein, partial [Anaerolineae bacterium]
QLRRTGDVVQADVVETSAFVDPQDPDDIKDAVYTLTYAFSVGGETYQRTQDLLPSEYTQLRDAESVPVRYWPDDPALSRIAIASSERFNTGGVIALGLGAAIFGGTGIVLLRGWLLSAARWQRLAEDGQLVEATITGAELDESGRLTVHFRFTPPQGGPPVEASDSLRRPDLEAAPEPDTPAAVLAADRELYQLL